jgi:hypothetical protein
VESIIRDRKDLSMEELLRDCAAKGIDEAEVHKVVDRGKDRGNWYEPTVGRIRVIG